MPERDQGGSTMAATITRFEPPHILGFKWGGRVDSPGEVVFELTSQGADVLLVLTHHRLSSQKELLGVSGGWHTHLDILGEHLSRVRMAGFWERFDGGEGGLCGPVGWCDGGGMTGIGHRVSMCSTHDAIAGTSTLSTSAKIRPGRPVTRLVKHCCI